MLPRVHRQGLIELCLPVILVFCFPVVFSRRRGSGAGSSAEPIIPSPPRPAARYETTQQRRRDPRRKYIGRRRKWCVVLTIVLNRCGQQSLVQV